MIMVYPYLAEHPFDVASEGKRFLPEAQKYTKKRVREIRALEEVLVQ